MPGPAQPAYEEQFLAPTCVVMLYTGEILTLI
jgi:hypothetical protein